jgi:hypothetical protein
MKKLIKNTVLAIALVASIVALNVVAISFITSLQQAEAAEVGDVKYFTGKLIDHPDSAYTHKLDNMDLNLILRDEFDKYLGQTVTVKVQYTTTRRFNVLSIVPGGSENSTGTTTSGYVQGSSTGYLTSADADSGYDYYLRSGSTSGDVMLRIRVHSWNESKYSSYIGSKVTLTYEYTEGENGVIYFRNAQIHAA